MLSRGQLAVRKAVSVLRHAKNSLFLHTKYGNHTSFRSCNFSSTTAIRRSLRHRVLKLVYKYSLPLALRKKALALLSEKTTRSSVKW